MNENKDVRLIAHEINKIDVNVRQIMRYTNKANKDMLYSKLDSIWKLVIKGLYEKRKHIEVVDLWEKEKEPFK